MTEARIDPHRNYVTLNIPSEQLEVDVIRMILGERLTLIRASSDVSVEASFQKMKAFLDDLSNAVELARRKHYVENVEVTLVGKGIPKKCKGAECYGCPVACPEKGYDVDNGKRACPTPDPCALTGCGGDCKTPA